MDSPDATSTNSAMLVLLMLLNCWVDATALDNLLLLVGLSEAEVGCHIAHRCATFEMLK